MSAPSESCPMCGRPPSEDYRPFCSKRCADLDLGRWLNEDYAIAGGDEEEEAMPPNPSNDDEPP